MLANRGFACPWPASLGLNDGDQLQSKLYLMEMRASRATGCRAQTQKSPLGAGSSELAGRLYELLRSSFFFGFLGLLGFFLHVGLGWSGRCGGRSCSNSRCGWLGGSGGRGLCKRTSSEQSSDQGCENLAHFQVPFKACWSTPMIGDSSTTRVPGNALTGFQIIFGRSIRVWRPPHPAIFARD